MVTPAPRLTEFCQLRVDLGAPIEMGQGRAGTRRIIPIVGGTATGGLVGEVFNLGADWQTVFADGLAELDTRYGLRTQDGAVIEIRNYGFRHGPPEVLAAVARGADVPPDSYYMRTHARLETGDARYAHLNRTLYVGSGARLASAVRMTLYALD